MSATQHSGRSSAGSSGTPGSLAMPTGVALTMPSVRAASAARSEVSATRAPKRDASRATSEAAFGCSTSLSISSSTASSSSSAWATAAPAPPAPSSRTLAHGAPAIPRRKLSLKPHLSVLWPMRRPSRITTVLTEPSASADSDSPSSSGMISCLYGKVTLRPSKPKCVAKARISASFGALAPIRSVSSSR